MIKGKGLLAGLCLLLILLLFAVMGCGGSGDSQTGGQTSQTDPVVESKTYEWDCLVVIPTNQLRNTRLLEWADNIKERTNGQLKITLKPAGELPYGGDEAISVISQGMVPIGEANPALIAGESQVGGIPTYPFLCTSFEDYKTLIDAITPVFEKEMADKGIKVLFFWPDPMQHFFGKGEPVDELSDMKGRKMRGQNAFMQQFAGKAGASSIAIPSTDIPQAMNRGMIDMFVTSSVSTAQGKYYEFIDWAYLVPFSVAGAYMVVNEDYFNELPAEFQQIVLEESAAASKHYWEHKALDDHRVSLEELENNGVTLIEPTGQFSKDGLELMKDDWDRWAKETGPYAVEALEAAKKALKIE